MQYSLQHQMRWEGDYPQLQALLGLNQLLQLSWPLPPLRGWAASPDFLLLIAQHARLQQPDRMVECSSGASTVVLAQCAKLNGKGHVFSLEHDADYAAKTRHELLKQGLQDWATVIHAPLKAYGLGGHSYQWYGLEEGFTSHKIDMLVIDGPPWTLGAGVRYPAVPLLRPCLAEGCAIFLDDADRPDEQAIVKNWQQEWPGLQAVQHRCEKGVASLVVGGVPAA